MSFSFICSIRVPPFSFDKEKLLFICLDSSIMAVKEFGSGQLMGSLRLRIFRHGIG